MRGTRCRPRARVKSRDNSSIKLRHSGRTIMWAALRRFALERDDFSSNRHPALAYWWSMIFIRTPVSTFRDHALPARGAALRYHLDDAVGGALVNEQVAFSRRSSVPKYAGVEPARRDRPAL